MDADPDPEPGQRAGDSGPADTGVQVTGIDQTSAGFDGLDRLVDLARTTLTAEGVTIGDLDLVVVDVEEMAELNATHMGHDGPTDVLSFPLDADDVLAGVAADDRGGAAGPPVHLGDVVLCPEVARRQAPEHCGSEEAELALLVIHGVLHILGHDHAEPDEAEVMERRERHHLGALGHTHPGAQGASC